MAIKKRDIGSISTEVHILAGLSKLFYEVFTGSVRQISYWQYAGKI